MAIQWNLADLFEAVSDAVPERTALICGDYRSTFAALDERATRLANHLASQGIGRGDHIGLYVYNGPEYVEGTFAAYKLGAVPINVNYRYVEGELAYLFDNADLKGLVFGREFAPRIANIVKDAPKLKVFVAVNDGTDEDISVIGATEYEAALAAASAVRAFEPRSEEDLYILYTGGTTGMPKGVMWTQRDFFLSTIGPLLSLGQAAPDEPAEFVTRAIENGGTSVSMPIAPLMHGAALWAALMAIFGGNTVVLTSQRKLDPHEIWRTVEREKVMSVSLVGDAMARPLIEALDEAGAEYDLSSLFVIGSGGAILSPAVKAKIVERFPNMLVIDSLGASETGYQGTVAGTDGQGRPRFAMGA
ncbi:MAG: AMP-binding protein, partial [Actinobacteria bacterium]|nr:AMP-binding protein [Actinomycetota bacterium]